MKIHILPHPPNFNVLWSCPRTELMVAEGLNKLIRLVNSVDEADYVFYTYVPQANGVKYDYADINKLPKEKLVCIDNTDEHDKFYLENPNDCFLYFKRSIPRTNKLMNFSYAFEKFRPFTYGVLDGFIPKEYNIFQERQIKFGCYLHNSCPNRSKTLQIAKQIEDTEYHCWVGKVSDGSRSNGNNVYFDPIYFDALNDTRLLLTCQPTYWYGDSRLWEGLANGCLVFTDRDQIDIPHKLLDKEHVIYYDINNLVDLRKKIYYYLEHQDEAEEIARNGQTHAFTWHSSHARMKYVIDKIWWKFATTPEQL